MVVFVVASACHLMSPKSGQLVEQRRLLFPIWILGLATLAVAALCAANTSANLLVLT